MASVYHATACILCDGRAWLPLPDPGPQSIASDLRIVSEPLNKMVCASCGIVMRPPPGASASAFFETGYALYAHAPGGADERSRQSAYAQWIAAAVPRPPARVLDVGCGNGSLLLALRELWPHAELLGCDPSAEAVRQSAPGVRLWQGTAESLPADLGADLIVSVNVLEHTPDPVRFIRETRRGGREDATLVLVCPHGGVPGVELLFADHLWSLAPSHLAAIARRAGVQVRAASVAPSVLGDFQMVVAQGRHAGTAEVEADPSEVNLARAAFLDAWRALDDGLLPRLHDRVVCFGIGEAAGLLRAYAPHSWTRVVACTADHPRPGTFGDLPVLPLDAMRSSAVVVAGVRPRDQLAVAARLQARFARVVTWYDLVRG